MMIMNDKQRRRIDFLDPLPGTFPYLAGCVPLRVYAGYGFQGIIET